MKKTDAPESDNRDETLQERRDFLKKSIYAAYTTPFIVSMLVDKANAAQSWNPGKGKRPPNNSKGKPPGVPPLP